MALMVLTPCLFLRIKGQGIELEGRIPAFQETTEDETTLEQCKAAQEPGHGTAVRPEDTAPRRREAPSHVLYLRSEGRRMP